MATSQTTDQVHEKNSSFLDDSTGETGSYPVAYRVYTLGRVNVGVWVFSTMGIYVRPEMCLLPAPGLSSAVAPGFPMTLHSMNTRGRKSRVALQLGVMV